MSCFDTGYLSFPGNLSGSWKSHLSGASFRTVTEMPLGQLRPSVVIALGKLTGGD